MDQPSRPSALSPYAEAGIGGARLAVNRAALGAIRALFRHWLLLINAVFGVYALLPFVAPYLLAHGYHDAAGAIYAFYSMTCHQEPGHSFFLWGEQMAFCQRDTAIYLTIFLAGLAYASLRAWLRPLNWRWYLVLILPMAVDGFTQLFGLRESTWALRLATGTLFGAATVWLTFPYVEQTAREVQEELATVEPRP